MSNARCLGPVRSAAAAIVVLAVVALAGCTTEDPEPTNGSGASDSPSDTAGSTSASPDATTAVEITFEGDQVTPSGERVEVAVGEPVELVVTADAPGELHVHSDPEQQIAYEEGTRSYLLQIDRPGVVEVESHDLGEVIVQLEAR